MEDLIFDKATLRKQLSSLDSNGLLIFGVLCCERMFPNYVAFVNQNNWGNADILRYTIDLAWSHAQTGKSDPDLGILKNDCISATPHPDHFQSLSVSSALDAALSIATLIDLIGSSDVQHAFTIASFAHDTVHMFVRELDGMDDNAPDLSEQVYSHDLGDCAGVRLGFRFWA